MLHFFEQFSYHTEYVKYLQALLQFTQAEDIPEMTGREIIHVHDEKRSELDSIGRTTRFKKIMGYSITALAWHPQQELVAVGSSNGMTCIYDLAKGDVLEIEHEVVRRNAGEIRSIAWSPDGQQLASGGEGQWICLWSIESGILNIRSELYRKLHVGDKKITSSLSWSPDSQQLASISDDQKLRIWQAESDEESAYEIEIPGVRVDNASTALAWSPDGNFLAVAYHESTWKWETESWQEKILQQETERVQCLAWSPDSSMLIGGTSSAKLLIWNEQSEREQQIFTERSSGIVAVAFLLDGKLLVSRHSDGILQFRETETWQMLRETTAQESFPLAANFAFNAEGNLLAMPIMRGHLLRIWEVQPERILNQELEEPSS